VLKGGNEFQFISKEILTGTLYESANLKSGHSTCRNEVNPVHKDGENESRQHLQPSRINCNLIT
jgi:hypothetical protein